MQLGKPLQEISTKIKKCFLTYLDQVAQEFYDVASVFGLHNQSIIKKQRKDGKRIMFEITILQ